MEKSHKILLSAMVIQTVILGGAVLFAVKPVVKHEVQTVEVVVTPTPTPRLLGVTGTPTPKALRFATPSGEVR